ncbi:RNase P modulator RnpM [Peptostreptococcus porci]|uniref:YlxR family protein n=1 Tax=Peptostreptococcus porci TaxID=2652282 RepID=A0A6N7WZG8_9FIRM|nr:YlxR family protein [Peptostreptococcus porci]MDD7182291.1 YlxR family protein [Peptostreptococcus porci]MDY2794097.1 YlxR family protein [Peptostreptococcus porci]MDY4129099.1 YlxR family protein [Peptostreptococcus porci]MDY4561835.1 YlxR family protein [Peptostreptococcus porci]MDY5435826.1 YlxR family protein [Peptostreptococcus porci]
MQKQRKIPQRKCIACQERGDKKGLIRVVKNKDNEIFLDPSGKANGRGAYVCATKECLSKAIKTKAFNRSFKMDVEDDVYSHLLDELEKIDSTND